MADHPLLGRPAPDFTLDGTAGPFRLADRLGERIVLLFYPGDETVLCTRQLCSYSSEPEELAALESVVVGISPQDVESHLSFMRHRGIIVPLLADPDRAVAQAYGVKSKSLGVRRAVFVIDEAGIVRFAKVHRWGVTYMDLHKIAAAVDALDAPAASAV